MKLCDVYRTIIKTGIDSDIRDAKQVQAILSDSKASFEKLSSKEKEYFDIDRFFNPYADTKILYGEDQEAVKSIAVGIDVDAGELLLVDRLREKGQSIDLVLAHHPAGRAYASFYDVMDLQIDAFCKEGISISTCENMIYERKTQVERRVHSANHQRSVDIAKLLKIPFLCVHTPADNCAHQFITRAMQKEKPGTLDAALEILFTIPEYKDAARNNNPPRIVIGNKQSRVSRIHVDFTGGTEGPESIYEKLSVAGIDTIIAMHQSEEHFKKCKEYNINVIFASHIASDALGVNIILDALCSKEKLKILEFSGFRRFSRNNK